jgi:hypothetical protein
MTEVYWNLHKHCYSVRERGRVVAHVDSITLRNTLSSCSALATSARCAKRSDAFMPSCGVT